MKSMRLLIGWVAMFTSSAGFAADDCIDHLDEALTVSAFQDEARVRLSGALDLESYQLQQPSPGVIYTAGKNLFSPRLSLFVDAQLGARVYAFVQARVDRGFDPSDDGTEVRLDEYAVRLTPGDGRFNLQIGKFATVVGNWVPRHSSWDNAFVTAPLPYENLTAIWDTDAADSTRTLLAWAHLRPYGGAAAEYAEKRLRTPIIWGPSYTRGAAISGEVEKFKYALEIKSGSLSSHPDTWDRNDDGWRHPSVGGRVGYRPNAMWNLGFSASTGPYLRPGATRTLAPGHPLGEYRETVFGQDISFAWHHLQMWAEFYEARFEIPTVGSAESFAYYTEAKYKFTPRFFASVRWNQQLFGTVPYGNMAPARWGRDVWRIDVAPAFRFTSHLQLKLQYSLQHEAVGSRTYAHLLATQFLLRF